MKILNNFLNFIKNNKKNIYFLAFLGIFFVLSNQAFAADPPKDNNAMAFNDIIGWVVILVGLLTQMIGYFLSPEWTNGVDIGILPKLKELWILVSNVVYFVFALMFVGLAFMNIIGKSDDYAFKTAIPRFIVGVIMVPLSWFIVQFVISLSSILTASVLALPFDMFADYKEELGARKVCTNIVVKKYTVEKGVQSDEDFLDNGTDFNPKPKTIVKCGENNDGYKSFKETLGTNMNMFSILNYYTYGVMKTDRIVNVDGNITDIFKDLFSLIGKIGFDFVFVILYLFLLIILGVSLLVRGIMLWIFMVLSPLFGLLYFIKKDPKGLEKFNFKEFISLAMVPVYVSAALSFGLLFIFVAGKSMDSGDKKLQFTITKDTANSGTTVITSGKGGSFTATTNMFPSDKVSAIEGGQETASKNGAVDIILKIFGLGILWAAIVAALSSSEITKVAAEPLQNIGSEAMNLAKKLPSSVPIIPTSQGMMSANNMAQATRTISGNIQRIGEDKASALSNQVSEKLGIAQNKNLEALQAFTRKINSIDFTVPGKIDDHLKELFSKIDPKDIESTQFRKQLSEIYAKMGFDKEKISKLEGISEYNKYTTELSEIIRNSPNSLAGLTNKTQFTQAYIKQEIDKNNGSPETPTNSGTVIGGDKKTLITIIDKNTPGGSIVNLRINNDGKITDTSEKIKEFGEKLFKNGEIGEDKDIKEKLEKAGIKDNDQITAIINAYKKAKEEAKPKP